jgi:Ca-activated chloride channel homolog
VHFFSLKYVRRKAFRFANFEALERIAGSQKLSKNYGLLALRLIVLFLLILSASGTIYWYNGNSSDFDYVIAIDASNSMLANDYKPDRLEAAKSAAVSFIDSLKSDANIAVMSFTGTTFIKQVLTNDLSKVKEVINTINAEEIGGTAIGDAMVTSGNLLFTGEKSKVIVLITDGQYNVGLLPDDAVKYMNQEGIVVHTIGIGTKEGGEFVEGAISVLDEDTLKFIAESTSGKYFKVSDETGLENAFKEVASSRRALIPIKVAIPFMLIALMMIITEWGLINSKYRTIP